jgi:hypothetical protein
MSRKAGAASPVEHEYRAGAAPARPAARRSGHPEDGADLVQHAPLPGAHPLGAEAEAALLAGIGSRLRRRQPPPERLGLAG